MPPPPRPLPRRTPDETAAVIDRVPADFYIRHPGRGDTLHWSDPAAIRRDVIALDVRAGARVLELGTGTGYSAAVLAALAGPAGRVTTIDVSDHLTGWARELHRQQGVTTVTCLTGDGVAGLAHADGHDRIVAWFTPPLLTRSWVERLAPGGRIVSCLPVAPLPSVSALTVIGTRDGQPHVERLAFGGGYALSHPYPVDDVHTIPPRWVDARTPGPDPSWISVAWRADDPHGTDAAAALDLARRPGHREPYHRSPVDWRAWTAFTASLGDPHLCTAALPDLGRGIGHATPGSAAFLHADGTVTADHPQSRSLRALRTWLEHWESAGRPGADAYTPHLIPDRGAGVDGWSLRLERTGAATSRPAASGKP